MDREASTGFSCNSHVLFSILGLSNVVVQCLGPVLNGVYTPDGEEALTQYSSQPVWSWRWALPSWQDGPNSSRTIRAGFCSDHGSRHHWPNHWTDIVSRTASGLNPTEVITSDYHDQNQYRYTNTQRLSPVPAMHALVIEGEAFRGALFGRRAPHTADLMTLPSLR